MKDEYSVLKSAKTKLGNQIELIGTSPITPYPSLIIGVFHGDEPQGKFLIEEYLNNTPLVSPSPQPSPSRGEGARMFSQFAQIKAKELRKNQTDAEKILWNILRANRLNGLHFKRQQPIGEYIVDFVCFEQRLIIELDGAQHNEDLNIEKDKKRTEFLESKGFKVIRIWNNEIFNNIEGVIEYIISSLQSVGTVTCSLQPEVGELRRGGETSSLHPEVGELWRGGETSSLPPGGGGLGRGGIRDKGLLFIPCLNPDGMQLGKRTNANGVDLNRNFPTKNWGEDTSSAGPNASDYYSGKSAGSEIETQFVIDVIEKYKPELILTLHAPYKIVNYDGPAQEIAEKISKIINYPVEASIGYPTPGSFGTYAGVERQIPTITLELDETCPVENLIDSVFEVFDLF